MSALAPLVEMTVHVRMVSISSLANVVMDILELCVKQVQVASMKLLLFLLFNYMHFRVAHSRRL